MALDRKWLVLVAVGIGTFMSALDGSVVNVILPVLRDQLHTSIATVEWVVTIYLLVVSGLLVGFGRLGDLRGHSIPVKQRSEHQTERGCPVRPA